MYSIVVVGSIVIGLVAAFMVKKQVSSGGGWESTPGTIKAMVWISALLNPIFGGIILYYSLRGSFPSIAKKANTISFIAFGLWVVGLAAYTVLGNQT